VVETAYGSRLGEVLRSGRALDLAGEPEVLGGHGRERFVYAPASGTFSTSLNIGDRVVAGQHVASIDNCALWAPLAGWLRGLTHDGADVEAGAKVIEVDASVNPDSVGRISERARRIAEGACVVIGLI
jgi:predicted deacylase